MTATDRPRGKAAAMTALAAGGSPTAAASAAGVSDRTVRRWRTDPSFQRELTALRGEMLHQTAAMLSASAASAVRTLHELLSHESGHVAVRAAATLLQAGMAFREHVELEDRLAALERATTTVEELMP